MTSSNVASIDHANSTAVPMHSATGDVVGWAGLPPARSNQVSRPAPWLFMGWLNARSAKPTTLRIAATLLFAPLAACAAPVGADQAPATQQQSAPVTQPAAPRTEPAATA